MNDLPINIQALIKPVIDQSNKIPEGWKLSPDEPYSIRRINPNRSEDTQRFRDIDRHPRVLEFMDPPTPSTSEDIDAQIRDPLLWAIADDKNEMIGWVQFYEDDLTPEQRRHFQIPENALVLETSYGKLFAKWPKSTRHIRNRDNLITQEPRGVAVSGLRQTMALVKLMEEASAREAGQEPRPVYITAFTNPVNVSSEGVLVKNGFQKQSEQVDYDGEMDNLWIKQVN